MKPPLNEQAATVIRSLLRDGRLSDHIVNPGKGDQTIVASEVVAELERPASHKIVLPQPVEPERPGRFQMTYWSPEGVEVVYEWRDSAWFVHEGEPRVSTGEANEIART